MAGEEKRIFDEMHGTWPNAGEVICKKCRHRDKTVVKLNGVNKYVGVTRSFCKAYPEPPASNGKPIGILFHGDMCEFYEEE